MGLFGLSCSQPSSQKQALPLLVFWPPEKASLQLVLLVIGQPFQVSPSHTPTLSLLGHHSVTTRPPLFLPLPSFLLGNLAPLTPSPLILAPHISSHFSVSLSHRQKGATRFRLDSIQIPTSAAFLRTSALSNRPVGDGTIPNFYTHATPAYFQAFTISNLPLSNSP
ncbi:hypothetical protein B0T10DRAFT_203612 [Thelonectria olida]|uniref:Uncharacterized protein n=1 Tax=Thelonectria olida TaxID=1576542 RepID=A0A9P8VTW6_9HYPO|nr:hypothetical protein B0T10DRAFT_203612 [Thelonectria olida]